MKRRSSGRNAPSSMARNSRHLHPRMNSVAPVKCRFTPAPGGDCDASKAIDSGLRDKAHSIKRTEDFLRHRRLPRWHPDRDEAMAVREIAQRSSGDGKDLLRRASSDFVVQGLEFPLPSGSAFLTQRIRSLSRLVQKTMPLHGGFFSGLAQERRALLHVWRRHAGRGRQPPPARTTRPYRPFPFPFPFPFPSPCPWPLPTSGFRVGSPPSQFPFCPPVFAPLPAGPVPSFLGMICLLSGAAVVHSSRRRHGAGPRGVCAAFHTANQFACSACAWSFCGRAFFSASSTFPIMYNALSG